MADRPGEASQADRRPLLERPDLKPEERVRIGRAAAVLLGWGLVATAVLGLLALWHLVRRGRILRANLSPPEVGLPARDRSECLETRRPLDRSESMHPATVPASRADHRPRRLPSGVRAEEVGLGRLPDRLRARERPGLPPAGDLRLEAEDPQGDRPESGQATRSARRSGSRRPNCPPGVDLIVVPRGPGADLRAGPPSLPSLARAVARRLGLRRREGLAMIAPVGRAVERAVSGLLIGRSGSISGRSARCSARPADSSRHAAGT